jgi:ABC-type multidrug transport system fused ATPase/permease subunit
VRFYDASEGRITIDGIAIEQFQLRSLRHRIALVLQDAIVASGTVAENIRYGRLEATDLEVEDAARAANAHDFIKHLAQGYDTELGEGATRLSGGQRQRLSIARAFLKDAPILILDEPTSALDTIAEIQVVDAIRRLWAGRTTFVVAHRLSTVRHADRILVMDRGRIVAQGTHEQLLDASPLYRQLAQQLVDPRLPQPTAHRVDALAHDRRGA